MDIVLVAGLWLDAHAWDEVVPHLEAHGHQVRAVTLPGQGDGATTATLIDQLAAVVAAIDASADPPLVVGHSAACTLAWLAADARPDRVAKVALIGGFPTSNGERYADFLPTENGVMPFPGWEPFAGPDSDDLNHQMRVGIEERAIAVPEGVTKALVRYGDARRHEVPALIICPEFTPDDARAWIESGDVPEMAQAKNLELVDIDSGHWPMISTPVVLAEVLQAATTSG